MKQRFIVEVVFSHTGAHTGGEIAEAVEDYCRGSHVKVFECQIHKRAKKRASKEVPNVRA